MRRLLLMGLVADIHKSPVGPLPAVSRAARIRSIASTCEEPGDLA